MLVTVNVYIKAEIRQYRGFKSRSHPSDSSVEQMSYDEIKLKRDKGRIYFTLREGDPIPSELKEFVEEISLQAPIAYIARRETGVYLYETAKAKLLLDEQKQRYWIEIKGDKMNDILSLLHKIRAGTVRPDESYEAPQLGKSRDQLEVELADVTASWVATRKKLNAISFLADDLRGEGWPFCTKNSVATRITSILNKK